MAVGAFFGQADVGGIAGRVDEGDAFGAFLALESCGIAQVAHQERALLFEVARLVRREVLVVEDWVVQEAARQAQADPAVAAIDGVGQRLGVQFGESLFEFACGDERWAPARGDQHRECGANDIEENVCGLVAEVLLLVALNAAQHTKTQQQSKDGDEIAAFFDRLECETDAHSCEARFTSGGGDHPFGDVAQGGLTVSAFDDGKGETEQDVAPAAKGHAGGGVEGAAGAIRVGSGNFVQARQLGVHGQAPAGVVCEPLFEPRRVAPDDGEFVGVGVGGQQRPAQQSEQGEAAFLALGGSHRLAQHRGGAAQLRARSLLRFAHDALIGARSSPSSRVIVMK